MFENLNEIKLNENNLYLTCIKKANNFSIDFTTCISVYILI